MKFRIDPAAALTPGLFPGGAPRRAHPLTAATLNPESLARELDALAVRSGGTVPVREICRSSLGRPVRSASLGRGPIRVILWSQMHGDEPTATLALLDLLALLAAPAEAPPWAGDLLARMTLLLVPMLNPDGAVLGRRQTATGIDMNRDARRTATPEGRTLAGLVASFRPEIAFNLHDQEIRSVGNTSRIAALSVLAPPADPERSITPVRLRAIMTAGRIARAAQAVAGGCVTRYDDDFEPRAFGDSIQASGVSTVLLESGHWPEDPLKEAVRTLNLVGLAAALTAAASGELGEEDRSAYDALPANNRRALDVVIRGLRITGPGGAGMTADAGFVRTGPLHGGRYQLREVGDLEGFAAVEDLPAAAAPVPLELLSPDSEFPRAALSRLTA